MCHIHASAARRRRRRGDLSSGLQAFRGDNRLRQKERKEGGKRCVSEYIEAREDEGSCRIGEEGSHRVCGEVRSFFKQRSRRHI